MKSFGAEEFPLSGVRNALLVVACAVSCAWPSASAGQVLKGKASVVDGDTIEIHGESIRFNGVDAPELAQVCLNGKGKKYRCGAKSADALTSYLSKSSPTACEFVERDRYGRFVGNCFRADGASVQEWLVASGHALDWPRYSNGAYSDRQEEARAAKRGLWSGTFETPWDWRANNRAPAPVASPLAALPAEGSGGCQIKGNVSAKCERIYHIPGQEHYTRTRISEDNGERLRLLQPHHLPLACDGRVRPERRAQRRPTQPFRL